MRKGVSQRWVTKITNVILVRPRVILKNPMGKMQCFRKQLQTSLNASRQLGDLKCWISPVHQINVDAVHQSIYCQVIDLLMSREIWRDKLKGTNKAKFAVICWCLQIFTDFPGNHSISEALTIAENRRKQQIFRRNPFVPFSLLTLIPPYNGPSQRSRFPPWRGARKP